MYQDAVQRNAVQPNAPLPTLRKVALCKDDELTNAFFRVDKDRAREKMGVKRSKEKIQQRHTNSASQTVVSPHA